MQDLKEIISLDGELKNSGSLNQTEQSTTVEEEHNCTECCFQGTGQTELKNHITFKHRIVCRNCNEEFKNKSNFMNHRKNKHLETVALCKNKMNKLVNVLLYVLVVEEGILDIIVDPRELCVVFKLILT